VKSIKALARDWLPPAISRWIRQQRSESISFEGDFDSWEEASAQCSGYDAKEILDKVLEATLKVKHGEAIFERDSVLFDQIEYSWPLLSGLMWGAARSAGKLNVLDFGGSLGSGYFQNKKFLLMLPDVHWSVVEQSHYVEAGQIYIQDNQLRFYKSIQECLSDNQPNIVLLSSVLQFLPDPFGQLSELLSIKAGTLIFDRTSFMNVVNKETIKIQHVTEPIYRASYPCRFFDEEYFCTYVLNSGYKKIETFGALDKLNSLATWKGHIFAR
jgi:putative methyltransferase (TIGR04325 family)